MRTVERKEKTLRRARVGPVHRRIRRRGERHVGIRQQPEQHNERQIRHEAPFDLEPPQQHQHRESRHHAIEKPNRRFQHRPLAREDCEPQIRGEDCQRARQHEVPKNRPPHQQHRQKRQRRHRDDELVIAEGQRQQKKLQQQQPQPLRTAQPRIKRHKEQPHQQNMQRVNLRNHRLRPHRKAERKEQRRRHGHREIQSAPARQPLPEDPPRRTRKQRRHQTRRERATQAAEQINLPRRIPKREQLKGPREHRPQRIPGRVRHAEMLRRHNELARIQQRHIRRRRPKIHRPRNRCGNQPRHPIRPPPNSVREINLRLHVPS